MKKALKGIFLSLSFLWATVMANGSSQIPTILMSQVVEHPALDQTRQGIIDALQEQGFSIGTTLNLRWESAQANPTLAQQIANKFVNASPDILVGVGTVSAQSFIKLSKKSQMKVIFSTVTDPVGAGLVKDLKSPQSSISGVSNFVPLEPQLLLFQEIYPQLKKIGVLYNMGEANSVSIVEKLKTICPKLGLSLVPKAVTKTAEVAQGIASLAPDVDAIFISNDNTALSAMGTILKVAEKAKIPVFVSDTDMVQKGALAALGPNQYEVGMQTGRMIARLLKGEPMEAQKVEFPQKVEVYVNERAANKLGISLPLSVRQRATQMISGVL